MYVDRCEGGLREGLKYLEMITAICRKMNLFVCIIVLIFKLLVNSIFAEHNSRVEIKWYLLDMNDIEQITELSCLFSIMEIYTGRYGI